MTLLWDVKNKEWRSNVYPFTNFDEAFFTHWRPLPPQPASRAPGEPTHRHVKRGTDYVLIGYGKMQSERWLDGSGDMRIQGHVDMREVAIYRSVADGSLWVRPREEFEDGRFIALSNSGGK